MSIQSAQPARPAEQADAHGDAIAFVLSLARALHCYGTPAHRLEGRERVRDVRDRDGDRRRAADRERRGVAAAQPVAGSIASVPMQLGIVRIGVTVQARVVLGVVAARQDAW
jgi:hypothetical protein